ncbi:DUF254-domain-containing protein [Vararia minispora EC-137]|uniref:DUF254-domain-containing protein n=1 Tax=Vararia minispora EC-137 TaxID=1314806 RepID=A0ACB8QJZ4_9AGAM|nr:DUF254-domain-containing protein [Vararia minispora EC-137]
MSHIPSRSRTASRSGTPTPSRSQTPSRFRAPVLRATNSVSSLHVQLSAQGHVPPVPDFRSESHIPSVFNNDTDDGILVPEAEADVDTTDGDVIGVRAGEVGDENSKKALRDQLRKTLSRKESFPAGTPTRRRRVANPSEDVHELRQELSFPQRQYFILTDAGKPVFASRVEDRDSDNLASIMGIMQAIISVFLDDGDKLRCVNAGKMRITFLLRSPLYYVCVSSWGEPESVTRTHLEYLHQQVLSVVTGIQLRKLFERRGNFDLGRLLTGAESLVYSLLDKIELDMAMITSSLRCLKLDASLRRKAASALIPAVKTKDLLYVILVAHGNIITLARPRRHSIHPSDLHILLNTIYSPSIVKSSASASWLPICLPKFNQSGFVNAFISFLSPEEHPTIMSLPPEIPFANDETAQSVPSTPKPEGVSLMSMPSLDLGLICVGGGSDFESLHSWADAIIQRLSDEGTVTSIRQSILAGAIEYSCSGLGIPGLRHFIYKSRSHVQITSPIFEDPYEDLHERRRLITLYQILHDNIHAKSGQDLPLKLQYIRTDREGVLGWITQPFEMYIAVSPRLPKSATIGAANAVARWVKKEEASLFLRDAPVF